MNFNDKKSYFEELAKSWDTLPQPEDHPRKIRAFVSRAMEGPVRRILDAGCGTGILLPALLEICPADARIVEMDFAWRMLRENRRKCCDPRVMRVCADAVQPPFPPASFDLVLCFNMLPHVGDPQRALAPLLAALAPSGTLAIGHLMSSEELSAFHAQLEGPVSEDRLPPVPAMASLLEALGTEVECAEEAPGWYFVRCRKSGGER